VVSIKFSFLLIFLIDYIYTGKPGFIMSLTQPHPSPISQTPRSRPVSLGSGVGQGNSLRLPKKPVDIPVPPSLTESPYLTSPHSIFRRAVSNPPVVPSQEDEEWLRDTVPLSWGGRDVQATLGEAKSLLSGMVVVLRREDSTARGRSMDRSKEERKLADSMSSPPLVRTRVPQAAVSTRTSNWIQRTTNVTPPIARTNSTISLRHN